MSYRFMRMMIFFDLPTDTIKDRREYARFRKYLIKSLVQMLCVTEKQYAGMEYIVGVGESDVLTTDERYVEL